MSATVSLALVGIGGYGNRYVSAVLDATQHHAVRLVAAIDPAPGRCARFAELRARDVPLFASMEDFYAACSEPPDLLVICSPPHLHADHTCLALSGGGGGGGSHVLCEKPLCIAPHDVNRMRAARDAAQKLVAIGYQWSFSRAIQRLKADVLSGRLGRPKRLRSLVLWPRDEAYYRRSRWAGAVRNAAGDWILDSPVTNACAHYLHNMLYSAGPANRP